MPPTHSPTPRRGRIVMSALACALAIGLVSPAIAAAKTYEFEGRGWGHGLGMSQWGARGLAEKGKSGSQILRYYYTGTQVESKVAPSGIRVGVLQERADTLIEADGRFDLHDSTGARKASGVAGERWRIVPDGNKLKVFKPGSSTAVFSSASPVTVKWDQYGTLLDLPQTGYSYKHGRLEVDINPSSGKSRAVLILKFEHYLYGLGEMPSSWHSEALKAQAIAGRTYALEKILRLGQNRNVCDCAVYATTADQAYVGVDHEVQRWVDAVNATKGLVVTYHDQPIQALYSSSTGGYTEHNENVFGGNPLPYLRGKCDSGDFYGGHNPHNNWTVTLESAEIEAKLRDSGRNVGVLQSITYVSPRGVSGRLTPLQSGDRGGVKIVGTLGTFRLSGGTFRSILGLKTSLVHFHIAGPIRARWDALNCAPGLPRYDEVGWKDLDGTVLGHTQNFNSGRLFLVDATDKVWWLRNEIVSHYDVRRAKGQEFGAPTQDTVALAHGRAGIFQNGRIYWSRPTAAHEVHGPILAKYLAIKGHYVWGYPTSDQVSVTGGKLSRFEKAHIYWSSDLGANKVSGHILKKYIELKGPAGKLGLPKGDDYTTHFGRRQDFVHGYITYDSSTKKVGYKVTS